MSLNPESKQNIVENGGDSFPSMEESERLAALKALKLETEVGTTSSKKALKINTRDETLASDDDLSDELQKRSIKIEKAPVVDLETLLLHKSLQPSDLNIGTQIVAHYLRNNLVNEAVDELRIMCLHHPRNEQLTVQIARLYVQLSEWDNASRFFEKTLKIDPLSKAALLEFSQLLMRLKEYDRAIGILERAKLVASHSKEIFLHLASCYSYSGQTGKVIENLKQVQKVDPDDLQVRVQLAEVYVKEELYPQAMQLLSLLPDHDELGQRKISMLVDCLIGEHRYDKATELLQTYIRRYDSDESVQRKWILLNSKLKLWDEVQDGYKKLFEMESNYSIYIEWAEFNRERGDFEMLEDMLEDGRRMFPREADLYYRLCRLYFADRPAKALDAIEQALKLEEPREEWCMLKGEILVRLGRHAQAIQWFRSIQGNFPSRDLQEYVKGLIDKDRSYRETYKCFKEASKSLAAGNFKAALELFRKLNEKVPDNVDWLEQWGTLAGVEGFYVEALQALERATNLCEPDKVVELEGRRIHLAFTHNDFEVGLDLGTKLLDANSDDVRLQLQQVRMLRHLLTDKSFDVDFFEDILIHWQDKARDTNDPLVLLRSSYNYLYLGSHLLDSSMWTYRAREGFNAILSDKEFLRYFPHAYQGLYMVYLMDYDYTELLGILRDWVRHDQSLRSRELYLRELIRCGYLDEGYQTSLDYIRDSPDALELRDLSLQLEVARWKRAGGNHDEALQILKSYQYECQNHSDDALVTLDMALALYHFGVAMQSQEMYSKCSKAFQRALRQSENHPNFIIQALKVPLFAASMNPREITHVYSKQRTLLEKGLSENSNHESLSYYLGKICVECEQDIHDGYKYLLKSITMNPQLEEANLSLGQYWYQQGDMRKAYHYFLKCIENPVSVENFHKVVELLQRIV
ncbi:MAG: tetratricopeptide repeat protein [bacterium]|nr:tetratricopeptide repeat protein [bacterium]